MKLVVDDCYINVLEKTFASYPDLATVYDSVRGLPADERYSVMIQSMILKFSADEKYFFLRDGGLNEN
jgi:hypothetical protein